MNKSERLLQLMVLLRGRRTAVTAEHLAQRMQVSVRTVYRDIQSLILSGMDIEGEAGVGYCLRPGSGIPPLMFNENEIEALMLGIRLVNGCGDDELRAGANAARDKIKAVLPPQSLQRYQNRHTKFIVPGSFRTERTRYSELIRNAIERCQVIQIEYGDENEKFSTRKINPLGMVFWSPNWTLAAWCQLRDDYRLFRLDRIKAASLFDESFQITESCSFEHYLSQYDVDISTGFWG